MREPVIQVKDVVKRFAGRTVLDRICLDVLRGETLVILGGSGSGKSTLLRLMIGSVPFDEGVALQVLSEEFVPITVDLGLGENSATAWTCDLTEKYVEINGAYRT